MELILPIYNAHPYFSLKNLGKNMRIVHGQIQLIFFRKDAFYSFAPEPDSIQFHT